MVFGKALRIYILSCQMRRNHLISLSKTYRLERIVIGDLVIVLAVGAADVHVHSLDKALRSCR